MNDFPVCGIEHENQFQPVTEFATLVHMEIPVE